MSKICEVCGEEYLLGDIHYPCMEKCQYCGKIPFKHRSRRIKITRYFLWFFPVEYYCPWDCPCLDDLNKEYRKRIFSEEISRDIKLNLTGYLVPYSEVEEMIELREYIDEEKILSALKLNKYYSSPEEGIDYSLEDHDFVHKIEKILLQPPGINIKKAN